MSAVMPLSPSDDPIDKIVQYWVSQVTGLDGTLVRPRWQPIPPKQPDANVNWCAVGVSFMNPDDGPLIEYDPVNDNVKNIRHEELSLTVSFYGPAARLYAGIMRDGAGINQNCEYLGANDMTYNGVVGPIHAVPELVNQQWIRRQDMTLELHRKVTRIYPIRYLAVVVIKLTNDEGKPSDPSKPVYCKGFRVPDVGNMIVTETGEIIQVDGALLAEDSNA